jgi:Spy/CpxP family protein refolding chaperone
VLELERDIKRLHISLAVRLKNRLTPEQQEQLHKCAQAFTRQYHLRQYSNQNEIG